MKKGLFVFRAQSPSAPCDLLVLNGTSTIVRVEVRVGAAVGDKLYVNLLPRDVGRFDALAVVNLDTGTVVYEPDIEPLMLEHGKSFWQERNKHGRIGVSMTTLDNEAERLAA
jgi:enoyl-CoA hydratase/carnithine racemase